MEGLQTTGTDDTALVFTDDESKGNVKDSKKKDRKELFQINTHPAAVVAANNKRDRRLKKIVMRVVAFCKKEHEEGQQIPFRFFKKRASVMTGVSLSTIHRIETIDMKASSPDSDESKVKARKEGAKKAKRKRKKKEKKDGENGAVSVEAPPAAGPQLIQYGDLANMANHIHFQTLPAANIVHTTGATKTVSKKGKGKMKAPEQIEPTQAFNINHHIDSTTAIITSNITSLQPAIVHSLAGVGGGMTTINVHNAAGVVDRAPCTWATGPIGPFTMGDLRDDHHVQVSAGSHLQVGAHSLPVAQLQPISMAGSHQTFTGQIDTSNWPAGTMAPFGTLQGTATLVGQQVIQTYQNNPGHPNHPQQQQQPSVFYQF